jgi:transcription factor C subunit 6
LCPYAKIFCDQVPDFKMRTRRKTGRKPQYTWDELALSSDDEAARSSNDDEDGNFNEDEAEGITEDDHNPGDLEPTDDEQLDPKDDNIDETSSQEEWVDRPSRRHDEKVAELEIFTETPWRNRYFGPLRNAETRGKPEMLLDGLYGSNPDDLHIAERLLARWYQYEVLPSKAMNARTYPIPSPWLPEGFESAQQAVLRDWYERYRINSTESTRRPQSVTVLSADEAESYLPETDGDLGVSIVLNPVPEKVRFTRFHAIAISKSDSPLSENGQEDEIPAGWLFDTGGLVLAMDWAPKGSDDPQILALAVIPHSDQAPVRKVSGVLQTANKQYGMIQLWEFLGTTCEAGFVRPSRKAPTFKGGICLDTGRARRLQWCPIKFQNKRAMGLLAVLCDGKVYVIEVGTFQETEVPTFGKWFLSMVPTR